jgi:hypothetical protein
MTWRNVSFALLAVCLWQQWRACNRTPATAPPTPAECAKISNAPAPAHFDTPAATADEQPADEAPPPAEGVQLWGWHVPAWAAWFAPQPGEDLRAYRDRLLPLAKAAIAPQRARVARSLDDFAAIAKLDNQQRAALDGAAKDAANAIEERVLGAIMNGDFSPATFKPMTGVAMARDLLETVQHANDRFMGNLREDQKAALAQHPFDFGDYLLFSTKWEDALSAL